MQDTPPKAWFLYDIQSHQTGSVVFTADSFSRAERVVKERSTQGWDRYSIMERVYTDDHCKYTGRSWHYGYSGELWKETV